MRSVYVDLTLESTQARCLWVAAVSWFACTAVIAVCRTGKLRSTGAQRGGHNLVTEQQKFIHYLFRNCFIIVCIVHVCFFSSCSLPLQFDYFLVLFVFLFLFRVCIYYSVLVSGYHKPLIEQLTCMAVYFKLMVA